MRKIIILLLIILSTTIFCIAEKTPVFENLWGMLTDNNYIIPKESSIWKFNAWKFNSGSGDWWLYGEDDTYYYSTETGEKFPGYIKIAKKDTCNFRFFNKENIQTWQKYQKQTK